MQSLKKRLLRAFAKLRCIMRNRLGHCALLSCKSFVSESKSMIYIWITFLLKMHWWIPLGSLIFFYNNCLHSQGSSMTSIMTTNIHTWAVELSCWLAVCFFSSEWASTTGYWIKKQKKNPREPICRRNLAKML